MSQIDFPSCYIKSSNAFCDKNKWVNAPLFRKSFNMSFYADKAEILISSPGFYELYINGVNVTKGYLAPYISNPDEIVYYDKYEVSQYLSIGENVIGVILGNGFANQCVDSWNYSKASHRRPPCFTMSMNITGEGKEINISGDTGFKTYPSPVLFDMYRLGMHYDARLEIEAWNKPGFDDSHWNNALESQAPEGHKILCTASPIKKQYELSPVYIEKQTDFCYLYSSYGADGVPKDDTHIDEGYLYDFGFSVAGVCRLKIKGERGQKVILRHAERLREGKFNLNSIYTYNDTYKDYIPFFQTDVYYLKGGDEEIFVPFFTYHGFRYVLVEGITSEQATHDLLTCIVFNSDIVKRAHFLSSDSTLNTLYDMGIRADLSNFHYFPTDCPHREKNGWTGDASVSASQLLLNFDCSEDFKMWLESFRTVQRKNGQLPGIIPTSGWGFDWGGGPAWDAALVNLVYYSLKYDWRIDIARDNAESIYRYLRYIETKRDDKGLIAVGLGDWVQPYYSELGIQSPLEFTDSVTIMDLAGKSAKIYEILGMDSYRQHSQELYDKMRSAIRSNLIDYRTMTVAGSCQTSQSLAIALGVFEADEDAQAYNRLIELIHDKDDHVHCGVLGLRYIFHVLFDYGDMDLAYTMISRSDAPSYGNMIELGGTALFESLHENGVQESQNHHFYGDILNLFISKLVGININPNMRDINEICIRPHFCNFVDKAEASYDTKYGTISVSYEIIDGEAILKYYVPDKIYGKVCIGNMEYDIDNDVEICINFKL